MRGNLSKRAGRGIEIGVAMAAAILSACGRPANADDEGKSAYVATDSMGGKPLAVSVVPLHARPELLENSVAVMSRHQAGVFYSMNDSDNEPLVFALDTAGNDRGVWRVTNATNVDWESASLGPCGARQGGAACLYIGDTGDDDAVYATRAIYRASEPSAADSAGFNGSLDAEKLTYVYPDGPHDVEAMFVAPNGDTFLITKRPMRAKGGRLRPALVYQLPAAAWLDTAQTVARLVDSLPVVPGSAPFRVVTDASLSPDAHHLAVRTYLQVFVFATDSSTGRVDHAVAPSVCNIVSLGEAQGEGISWVDNRGRFVFTSEGGASPLVIANCPVPR
jgi:hypothetical protein